MSLRFFIVLLIFKIFSNISALVELPQVDKNNILETDIFLREIINKLFSILRLKVNEHPVLKQYSLIHNYLVSTSLHDYTNLIEIAKLTRVDKTKLNNQTQHFMATVIEILDEDIKHDSEIKDGYVIKHIEGFLKNLEEYTDNYKYDDYNVDYIITEILKLLEKNETLSELPYYETLNSDKSWFESSSENITLHNENEFWEPSGRRIYQSKKTNIKDFPFMASVQIFNHFQCAGSIIKSDLIITAASCLQLAWNNRFFRENPAFLSARVGSTFHNGGGENIPILEAYFHPGYDPQSLRDNLCVLRLYRVLFFSRKKKKLRKIIIDRKANALPSNTRGITIVGWGARRRNNIVVDPYLSFAVLDFYLLRDCQDVYSKKYVTHKHFCAGSISVGSGACNRDVGGPGIVHGILVGVVSFGSPVCGTPDAPTVFTKLGYYADWIDGIMNQKVPMTKRRTTTMAPFNFFTIPTEYEQTKTTYKLKPPVYTKKPKFLTEVEEVEVLRNLKNQGLLEEFINTFVGSKEAQKLLREATEPINETTTSNYQPDATIQFTYSPVTTLEPPETTSTNTSVAQENQAIISTNLQDQLVEQIPVAYVPESTVELQKNSSIRTGVMKADDKLIDTYEVQIPFKVKNKEKINANSLDKQEIKYKEKELNAKLEEDIMKILDEINLQDFFIKGRKPTEDAEQKNYTDILSGENEGKREGGREISRDISKNVSYTNNTTENIIDSDKVLFQIVTDILKEELYQLPDKDKTHNDDLRNQNREKKILFNDEIQPEHRIEYLRAVEDTTITNRTAMRKKRKHTKQKRKRIKHNKKKTKNHLSPKSTIHKNNKRKKN